MARRKCLFRRRTSRLTYRAAHAYSTCAFSRYDARSAPGPKEWLVAHTM